ncbi:MAG TPA: c-type cytochrome [Burkholderiales bacterium]|nr:c-type cytochrome [Burkholderiales bacterium]
MPVPTKRGALALLFFFALPLAAPAAGGDPVAGKRKTLTCNACHGTTAFKSMPRLGGQSAAYVVEALRAFKAGKRSHNTMRDVAGALSERDMADLGAHYASIPRAAMVEGVPPESAAACVACHGAQGDQPASPEIAVIAGQSAPYIEQVLKEYRAGTRANAVMQAGAKELTDAQISELAAYFAARAALVAR